MKCSLASVESFILPHEDDIMFTSHVGFFSLEVTRLQASAMSYFFTIRLSDPQPL